MTSSPPVGTLGPYRLLRRIGEGGMGVVHLGLDPSGTEVAVKILHPWVAQDQNARKRLAREVEVMRRVRSRHVAEVLDADPMGPHPYVVTRYVPGRPLADIVSEQGPLSEGNIVRLAQGLSAALAAIHEADIVHRDLKPANVMIYDHEPVVIDFGIAHIADGTRLTQTGMMVGTPGYLAPEVIQDSALTGKADIHALGSTLYYAVTGRTPFDAGTFEAMCHKVLEGKVDFEGVPSRLVPMLRAAMNADPSGRPDARRLLRHVLSLDGAVALDDGDLGQLKRTKEFTIQTPAGQVEDDFSDLLTPVKETERVPPPAESPVRAQPAPVVPAPGPGPYAPGPQMYPPQRVPPPGRMPPPGYGPPGHRPPPPHPGQGAGGQEPDSTRRASRPFLAFLLLALLAAAACVLPVIMGWTALALFVIFRAVGYSRSPVGFPIGLVRSILMTLLTVWLSVFVALIAFAVLYLAAGISVDRAVAYGTGLFILGLFFLPGGGKARDGVVKLFSFAVRGPAPSMVVGIALTAVTLLLVVMLTSMAPDWYPWRPPSKVVSELYEDGKESAAEIVGGLIADFLEQIGLR